MRLGLYALPLAASLWVSSGRSAAPSEPLTAAEILDRVTVPAEFKVEVLASPPELAYPVFLSAAPDGTLFVGCDENGSLGREKDRGKVLRVRDLDGDGRADEYVTVARMDSPRGLAWDGGANTLYVMHPPDLTAFHDDDGDGVADRSTMLVSGLGFGLDFRGADHTTNGIRLAIDGWIYVAVGDYGAVKATGRDGRTLSLRGGGIVRVRPDGSGLEQVSSGQRNILAVAVSPTLDLFTRDNTNDGDDWNVRLSHVPFGAEMGYPSLYRNFPDEIMPAMADVGTGSPVGALYIDEPALPSAWAKGFFSVEWGRNEIYLHPLTKNGASWSTESRSWLKLPRPTDMEVDGQGRVYVSSWDGGSFNYGGANVGYLLRVTGKSANPEQAPDFKTLSVESLVGHVGSASGVWRLAAQRELLARDAREAVPLMEKLAGSEGRLEARVAAIFTLKLLGGAEASPALTRLLPDSQVREYVLRALSDDISTVEQVPTGLISAFLSDRDARVRLQAVIALGRLGRAESANALVRLTADPDPTVAHAAVQMLRRLRAVDACFAALDDADPGVRWGALKVLQTLPEPSVVDRFLDRLEKTPRPGRLAYFTALARLSAVETPFTDPKQWWGTRPDTSGPLFKPEPWSETVRITAALKRTLENAAGDEAKQYVGVLLAMKVTFPGFTELMLEKAGEDAAARLELIGPLVSPKVPLAPDLVSMLQDIVRDPVEAPPLRARALRLLTGSSERNLDAVVEVISISFAPDAPAVLVTVWEEFASDIRHAKRVNTFSGFVRSSELKKRVVGAAVLVNLATTPLPTDARAKQQLATAFDAAWKNHGATVALLEAIGRSGARQFEPEVTGRLGDPDPRVAEAARAAAVKLGSVKTGDGEVIVGRVGFEEVVAAVAKLPGSIERGKEIYAQRACSACHTVSPTEPLKGPMLGGIAERYGREEILESILLPNAKVSQGFESQVLRLRNGTLIEGFVVREGGGAIELRDVVGVTNNVRLADVEGREKRATSIMPEGLLNEASAEDLAGLLAFLESTSPSKK